MVVDEAGNELSPEELADLRRAEVENGERSPVLTRSRTRAQVAPFSKLCAVGVSSGFGRCFHVAGDGVSRDLLLAYYYAAKRAVRRGMREVTAERAASLDFVLAKEKELASWRACNVYDVVDDSGQRSVTCRWVLVDKVLDDGAAKAKACLVVRGFQERGVQDMETFSPTCSKSS